MRFTISILAISILNFVFAQDFIQLGNTFPAFTQAEITSTSLGTPILAYSNNGELKVQSFIGGSWSDLDNTVPVLGTGIADFDIEVNTKNDEIFLSYTTTSGLNFRKYVLSWSGAQLMPITNLNSQYGITMALNPNDSIAYFLTYRYGGIGVTTAWKQGSMNTLALDTMPSQTTMGLDMSNTVHWSEVKFNQQSNKLFYTYRYADPWFLQYDGSSWSYASPNMITTKELNKSYIVFDTLPSPGSRDVIVATRVSDASGPTVSVKAYNFNNNSVATILPETNWGTNDITTHHFVRNPVNGYLAMSYQTSGGSSWFYVIKIYDGNSWNTIYSSDSLGAIRNLHFSETGDLYACFASGVVLKRELFYTSVDENESLTVNLYPNPSKNQITVSSKSVLDQLSIYSVDGTLVWNNAINTDFYELILDDFSSGMYIMKGTSVSGNFTKSFVKE